VKLERERGRVVEWGLAVRWAEGSVGLVGHAGWPAKSRAEARQLHSKLRPLERSVTGWDGGPEPHRSEDRPLHWGRERVGSGSGGSR
jgi:hypothetical protein